MKTLILYNGSKWAGEGPDPLQFLEARLVQHPLDPHFASDASDVINKVQETEWIGGKVPEEYQDYSYYFFGNFWDLSAAFRVFTNDPAVIGALITAIERNIASPGFQHAKAQQEEAEQERKQYWQRKFQAERAERIKTARKTLQEAGQL
jgi:hypothetical protein